MNGIGKERKKKKVGVEFFFFLFFLRYFLEKKIKKNRRAKGGWGDKEHDRTKLQQKSINECLNASSS